MHTVPSVSSAGRRMPSLHASGSKVMILFKSGSGQRKVQKKMLHSGKVSGDDDKVLGWPSESLNLSVPKENFST